VLLGVVATKRWEDKRARRSELIGLRAAKAERLRRLYAPIAQSALTFFGVAAEQFFLFGEETEGQRDLRHREMMTAAAKAIEPIGGILLVEPGAEAVQEAYQQMRGLCQRYLRAVRDLTGGLPALDEIRELDQEMTASIKDLLELAKAELRDLELPPAVESWGHHRWRIRKGRD